MKHIKLNKVFVKLLKVQKAQVSDTTNDAMKNKSL